MKAFPETIPIKRYVAIDSHKHYVMVGGMNAERQWTLRPRKVQMFRFRAWAAQNLKVGDAVVLETTANVWDIYDIVAPLVSKTVVANAYKVRQIAEARVKTDLRIVEQLETHKAEIDQKLAELSNTAPWADDMVYLMQIPGFGLLTSMILLAAVGDIERFSRPKKLVGYAGLGAGVHSSGQKHQEKSITKQGRKELRWVLVQAAWAAVRSDPYWKAQYQRLTKVKHPNKAIVAIARRLLVAAWHILSKRETYRHFDHESIAYKMMIWSQRMDEKALRGLTRQQFIKYGLLRLGVGQDLTRIVRKGVPRRIAPTGEVLKLRPDLKPPG